MEIMTELVPLTHLALEVTADELARAVANHQTHVDDIGRVCFDRDTARRVIADHRAAQAAQQELRERRDAELRSYAAEMRSTVGRGIPANADGCADVLAREPGPQYTQVRTPAQVTGLTPMQLLQAREAKQ